METKTNPHLHASCSFCIKQLAQYRLSFLVNNLLLFLVLKGILVPNMMFELQDSERICQLPCLSLLPAPQLCQYQSQGDGLKIWKVLAKPEEYSEWGQLYCPRPCTTTPVQAKTKRHAYCAKTASQEEI